MALIGRHAQLDGIGVSDLIKLSRVAFSLNPSQIPNVTVPYSGSSGSCLSTGSQAASLFADFRDDAVLEQQH